MIWSQPLRFKPVCQGRVWGGRGLANRYGRELPDPQQPYGECWEISDRPEAQSLLVSGGPPGMSLHELWTGWRREVFGDSAASHPSPVFPVLMKILDASAPLSIQVHPPAAVAAQLGGQPKTELWHVVQAEPGAVIYAGLRAGVDRARFEAALADGSVAELLHRLEPQPGDSLFLPSGRIHALGAGVMVFEIQQNSDTTYRVFDWNRRGLDGQPRPLHVAESLHSIDFQDLEPAWVAPAADGRLGACADFEVRLARPGAARLGAEGEHLSLAVVAGRLELAGESFRPGDFAMLPAGMTTAARQGLRASADAEWLEIRVPAA